MTNIFIVIFFSLIGGVVSLIGGIVLLASKKRANWLANYATPFAAGALLAAAFTDLLQEAAHEGDINHALTATLGGILTFFLLERFLHWFHHHHEHTDKKTDPTVSLIVIGDTVHNFIDGIAIAAGFLVSTETGIVVTLAVAAHEIPQEIGDFGLLIKKGLERKKVLLINIMSAFATTLAAVIFYQLGQSFVLPLDIILGLVAGFFIYIAVSDIIPSIHQKEQKRIAGSQTIMLFAGVIIVGVLTSSLHNFIDQEIHTRDEADAHSLELHEDDDLHEGEHHHDEHDKH